jgi:hypothetical protein
MQMENHEQVLERVQYPIKVEGVSFRALEKWLKVDLGSKGLEAKREIKSQAIRKLELLDEMHKDLVTRAQRILEQAQEDLRLHDIPVNATKIRGTIYHLYQAETRLFFSILEPAEYRQANAQAAHLASYRLNEDNTWAKIGD